MENKYITTADYNKFTNDIFTNKIKSKGSVNKSANAGSIDNADLDNKIATVATKAELKTEQDKITKLKAFDSSFFCETTQFDDDVTYFRLSVNIPIF